jgi:hypothetical protein
LFCLLILCYRWQPKVICSQLSLTTMKRLFNNSQRNSNNSPNLLLKSRKMLDHKLQKLTDHMLMMEISKASLVDLKDNQLAVEEAAEAASEEVKEVPSEEVKEEEKEVAIEAAVE